MSKRIEDVKEMYAAFNRADVPAMLSMLTDDVRWEYEAVPELLTSGIRNGRAEVARFFQEMNGQGTDHLLTMTEFLSNEDSVASFGRYRTTIRANGIRVDTPIANYLKFKGDKIERFVVLSNSALLADTVRKQASAATA